MWFNQLNHSFFEVEKGRGRIESTNRKVTSKSIRTILSVSDISKDRFFDEIHGKENKDILVGRVESLSNFVKKISKKAIDTFYKGLSIDIAEKLRYGDTINVFESFEVSIIAK